MDLNIEDIDINNDKMLTEIPIIISNQWPTKDSLSVHKAKLYRNKDAKYYYVFEYITGTSVMNYLKKDYEELRKIIPIDDITIFQMSGEFFDKVPISYRK